MIVPLIVRDVMVSACLPLFSAGARLRRRLPWKWTSPSARSKPARLLRASLEQS